MDGYKVHVSEDEIAEAEQRISGITDSLETLISSNQYGIPTITWWDEIYDIKHEETDDYQVIGVRTRHISKSGTKEFHARAHLYYQQDETEDYHHEETHDIATKGWNHKENRDPRLKSYTKLYLKHTGGNEVEVGFVKPEGGLPRQESKVNLDDLVEEEADR